MFKWLKKWIRSFVPASGSGQTIENTIPIRNVLQRTLDQKKELYTKAQMKVAILEAVENQVKLGRISDSEADTLMAFVKEYYG